ncbi:MAG: hypothetical protein RBT78_02410 [Kiritimatiellia bacterium]|nr:hypothetical protein [Kiritimatiellia bacterium]
MMRWGGCGTGLRKSSAGLVCLAGVARAVLADGPLDLAGSLAEPGAVRPQVVSASGRWEIADWTTAEVPAGKTGTFTLRFAASASGTSLLTYDADRADVGRDGAWQPLPPGTDEGLRLRVRPLPAEAPVRAVRLELPAKLTRFPSGGVSNCAALPFVTALPFRAVNVAPEATVTVSSADKLSSGFQPKPWLNRPETLNDGFVDAGKNFATAPRDAAITAEAPEWLMMSWDQPQSVRLLGLLRGKHEKGIGQAVVEAYAGEGDPRFATGASGWRVLPGEWTAEGAFRSLSLFDFGRTVTTRGLRLRITGGVKQAGVGELLALRDLGKEPVPARQDRDNGTAPITFAIPGPGKVTIQVRDAQGQVVANPVTGVGFPSGTHTVRWKLDDVTGGPVLKPGRYAWRGLYVPGLKVDYRYTYYPFPLAQVAWQTPDRSGGWLADHEPPRTICRVGDRLWLGAFAEAGDSIVEADADANKLWGIDRIWVAIPSEICGDGGFYYGFCEGGWIGDNQAIIQIDARTKASRKIFQRETNRKTPFFSSKVSGFQVVGTRAFVSFGSTNLIQVFDIAKGLAGPWRGFGWDVAYKQFEDQKPVLVKEIALPSPGRLRKYGVGKLVTTSGKDLVTLDLATCAVEPLVSGRLRNPLGLGVDAQGNLFVGEGEPLHQVFGYAPDGRVIATLGKPGRRETGPFDVDNLEEPYGVEVGPDGRVWVMEHTHFTKRVSLWDPKTQRCVKAVYGPTQYGGDGCIDPADENRLFYKGMEFRRDPKSGTVTPVKLLYRPDTARLARFAEGDYPSYAFRARGGGWFARERLWFTSYMHPHGHPSLVLWQDKGDHVQPVAALGSAFALRAAFGEPEVNRRQDRQAWSDPSFLTNHVAGYSPDRRFFTWTDLNDDGNVQPAELKFGKLEYEGKLLNGASAGWTWRMNRAFETAANAGEGRMVFFRPSGFSRHGYPLYDVPAETFAGSGESLMPDGGGNAIVLGGPLTSVAPDGTVRWRYRNDWPGLHAGHRTTARGDEPGVLIAPTRIWGIVPVNRELGEVVSFNSNLGCTYLMTADDGLFIDRVFRDQRVGLLWNSPTPPAPDVLAETSLYDEHFGGIFQKIRGNDGRDRYTYVCGKNHCSVVELTGLDKVRRLAGGVFEVTPAQIAAAQEQRQRAALRTAQPKIYNVHRVTDGRVKVNGRADEWPGGERIDGFALAYDAANLYVLYQGRDDRATFENKGVNPLELFKTGDVLDVMLQTRRGLDVRRTEAGPGDIRLSFAMFEGEPRCVLYDFKAPGFQGQRVPFSSPWRTVWCDRAAILKEAQVAVTRRGQEVVLEAAVPLEAIGLDPAALGETRGDVGRVLSDQTGTRAASRVYWANKNTVIMSDLPSEAALQPNLWGLFRFGNK